MTYFVKPITKRSWESSTILSMKILFCKVQPIRVYFSPDQLNLTNGEFASCTYESISDHIHEHNKT